MARAASSPSLNPELRPGDPETARWLAQVTLRLRRELTWLRRDGELAGSAQEALDLTRFHDDKLAFFAQDATAKWLGDRMAEAASSQKKSTANSAWQRAASALNLDDAAQFVLACALAGRADAAFGPVAAAANGEAGRGQASLALAQRLWDEPLAVLPCADAAHPLQRSGLITTAAHDWSAPLLMPASVAQVLLGGIGSALPAGLREMAAGKADEAAPLVHWLRATPAASMQVVPIVAPRGADLEAAVARVAGASQRRVAAISADIGPLHPSLPGLAAAAWLLDLDLLAPESWIEANAGHEQQHRDDWTTALAAIPVRWFLPVGEAAPHTAGLALLAPALTIAPLAVAERRRRFESLVKPKDAKARATEAARRFRVEERAVTRIETAMRVNSNSSNTKPDIYELARAEAATHMAQLATPVSPRFTLDELVLPPRESRALDAIVTAMQTLGRVHEEWGTARAWNEGGLAVMFCGPPGTGKTMAAEALAASLELPMYRVDLSQVVNKYIGETEKNLRRIFDAAESSDCLLFFDEADALFGKRTEVRDSHDRFANLEISYLLERMERFRGLAILATNRRKDLDTAFLRRLRYIVEFPVPGVAERARLWAQVFPAAVDTSGVDIDFLARRFEVAGGAIRSAAFNACLQAAARERTPSVAMTDVVRAVKSELEKSGPEIAAEQFGSYAHLLKEEAR